MKWHQAVDQVRSHVYHISTPAGSGTGFLVSISNRTGIIAIATAAHVIDSAHAWEEPIRIRHAGTDSHMLLRKDDRAVILREENDSAAIVFTPKDLGTPKVTLPLAPEGKHVKVGAEIGWLGFPAIPRAKLCFFSGSVSAWLKDEAAYLVDGVAINGVSGGPAFYIKGDTQVTLMGIVSAYAPNRATGETLPGLSVIRDVSQFHDLTKTFASLDQAKAEESSAAVSPEPIQDRKPPDAPITPADGN